MPLLAAAGIGAVGSVVGGLIGSSASKKAAAIQAANAQHVAQMATDATKNGQNLVNGAINQSQQGIDAGHTDANNVLAGNQGDTAALLKSLYGDQMNMLDPYQKAGNQGITSLMQMLSPGGDLTKQFDFKGEDLQNDPGYQFQLQQGQKALNASAAARGALQSGGNLKAMSNYNQGLAGTSFGNAYNRALTTFQTNRSNTMQGLNTLIGVGQTANSQALQAGEFYGGTQSQNNEFYGGNMANNDMLAEQEKANIGMQGNEWMGDAGLRGAQIAGSALTGGANAQAAGTVGAANAWNGAIGGVTNAAQLIPLSMMQTSDDSSGSFTPYSQGRPFNPASTWGLPPNIGPQPGGGPPLMPNYGPPSPYVPAYSN